MRNDLSIREARPSDAPNLAEAWMELGSYHAHLDPAQFRVPESEGLVDWVETRMKEELAEDGLWLVAERDQRLVGYVAAHIWGPEEDADRQVVREIGETVLKIDALMVTEHERRRGVGMALMQAAEEWGRRKGASQAILNAYAHSPTSVPFYEDGMAYVPKMIGFWKSL